MKSNILIWGSKRSHSYVKHCLIYTILEFQIEQKRNEKSNIRTQIECYWKWSNTKPIFNWIDWFDFGLIKNTWKYFVFPLKSKTILSLKKIKILYTQKLKIIKNFFLKMLYAKEYIIHKCALLYIIYIENFSTLSSFYSVDIWLKWFKSKLFGFLK